MDMDPFDHYYNPPGPSYEDTTAWVPPAVAPDQAYDAAHYQHGDRDLTTNYGAPYLPQPPAFQAYATDPLEPMADGPYHGAYPATYDHPHSELHATEPHPDFAAPPRGHDGAHVPALPYAHPQGYSDAHDQAWNGAYAAPQAYNDSPPELVPWPQPPTQFDYDEQQQQQQFAYHSPTADASPPLPYPQSHLSATPPTAQHYTESHPLPVPEGALHAWATQSPQPMSALELPQPAEASPAQYFGTDGAFYQAYPPNDGGSRDHGWPDQDGNVDVDVDGYAPPDMPQLHGPPRVPEPPFASLSLFNLNSRTQELGQGQGEEACLVSRLCVRPLGRRR